ncbi:helix-turn-helix transcriptional regulator [Winogradskyella sp.]|uniref:response regulator transcription factor n=1 Tax=Winogradskyella sp. TaxID=1883156 RepID=UPI0025D0F171|nr:helix-turn-helix transcriptional regulator [Winogradskyella sp.]
MSYRERDVIRLLVQDLTSKEISERLNISSHTVDTHRRNILKKLNISSTRELVGMLKINKNLILSNLLKLSIVSNEVIQDIYTVIFI